MLTDIRGQLIIVGQREGATGVRQFLDESASPPEARTAT
jgi:hypothetical protein